MVPMSEWSDWYRREDPAGWVLPRILRTRAEEQPDRDYLKAMQTHPEGRNDLVAVPEREGS